MFLNHCFGAQSLWCLPSAAGTTELEVIPDSVPTVVVTPQSEFTEPVGGRPTNGSAMHGDRSSARQRAMKLIMLHHMFCALYCLMDVLVGLFVLLGLISSIDLLGPWLELQLLLVVWVVGSAGFTSYLVMGGTGWRKWLDTIPLVCITQCHATQCETLITCRAAC